MRFYVLVSAETQKVIEFYATIEEAEATLAECLEDEPRWANVLRVEPVEFETSSN